MTRVLQRGFQLRQSVDKLNRLRAKEPPIADILLAEEAVVILNGFGKSANAR